MEIITKLKACDVNDLAPLVSISTERLARIQKSLLKDETSVPEGNRIYYFSRRLNMKPAIVSQRFSTHTVMFTITFAKLKENLELMLSFGIEPANILNDLWAFTRSSNTTKDRLELCQKTGKGNLKPWVIACNENKLDRSLTITEDQKSLLGDGTVIDYLSQRLNYDVEQTKAIATRYKAVSKVRVAKVRSEKIHLKKCEYSLKSSAAEKRSRLSPDRRKVHTRRNR